MSSNNEIYLNGDAIPHPEALSKGWVDNVLKWPDLQSSEVLIYLLESPSDFDGKSLKAYESTKAFSYYKDGWVTTCFYNEISTTSQYCYIKANVLPSMKLNEKHHKVWVLLEKSNGSIMSASCSCVAGLGQCCNHIAALLFKIEDAVISGYNSISCTSMPCEWNRGCTKPIENLPLGDMKNIFQRCERGKTKKRSLDEIEFEPIKKCTGNDFFNNVLRKVADFQPTAPIFKSLSCDSLEAV